MVNLIIADDHQLIRESLKTFLEKRHEFHVVEIVKDALELRDVLEEDNQIDVVVTDLHMPGMSTVNILKNIRLKHENIKVIVFTSDNKADSVIKALNIGVDAYVLKNTNKSELIDAISAVKKDEKFFSQEISQKIVESFQTPQRKSINQTDFLTLTEREQEVLHLTGEGYTNHEIGSKLNISFRTVDTHKRNMIKKTGARNMVHLVKLSCELALSS